MDILNKQCSKCGIAYPATTDFFPPRLNRKCKLHSWCRKCNRKRYKIYNNSKPGKERTKNHGITRYKRDKIRILERDNRYRKTIKGHLQQVFHCIKQRCNNPKIHNYNRYGGRGIKNKFVSLKEFVDYVFNELQIDPRGLQIDRIDNNGHYEKGNIRFVTAKENSNNRRYNEN